MQAPSNIAVVSTAVSGESLDFLMDVFIVFSVSPERPDSGNALRWPPEIYSGTTILGLRGVPVLDLVQVRVFHKDGSGSKKVGERPMLAGVRLRVNPGQCSDLQRPGRPPEPDG